MSEWKAKRFWDKASVVEVENGFSVTLDGRSVKTPAKTLLVVPTRAMAEAIAVEWDAQVEEIDPLSMPVTRSCNAALDKVTAQFDEVVSMLAEYGATDLLSYRAEGPRELIARQAERWDPLLDWAETALDARLRISQGIMPVAQDEAALARLTDRIADMSVFELTAFHDLVGISGSLILGFAVFEGFVGANEAWDLSRIDEDWQIEQWGHDEEADEMAAKKKKSFVDAEHFLSLCRA